MTRAAESTQVLAGTQAKKLVVFYYSKLRVLDIEYLLVTVSYVLKYEVGGSPRWAATKHVVAVIINFTQQWPFLAAIDNIHSAS